MSLVEGGSVQGSLMKMVCRVDLGFSYYICVTNLPQEDLLSIPDVQKALFLLSIFTYNKSILFIDLSLSSTKDLLSLVLLKPFSIF